jgi:hypothetical protein
VDLFEYIPSMTELKPLDRPFRPKARGLSRTGVLPSLAIDESGTSGPGRRDLYYVGTVLFHLLGQGLLSCKLLPVQASHI